MANQFQDSNSSGLLKDYYVDDSGMESKNPSALQRALKKNRKKRLDNVGNR